MRILWGGTLGAALGVADDAPSRGPGPPDRNPLSGADARACRSRPSAPRHRPSRLRLLARYGKAGTPRFEETIDVVERAQPALDSLLRGYDTACGPTTGGPPPVGGLNAYRGATIPLHVDFLGPGKLLWNALRGLRPAKPQWFLYRVRREDAVLFVLREGEASSAERYAKGGATWEELARFGDRARALDSLRRLERGFATVERRTNGERLPPWVATTCPPPDLR